MQPSIPFRRIPARPSGSPTVDCAASDGAGHPSSSDREPAPTLMASLRELRQFVGPSGDGPEFVAESVTMRNLLQLAARFAASGATILITGESGTGKEVLARWIHHRSTRQEGRLVCVNCAALSPTLYESELFGHEIGAFTGASGRREGRIEFARRGTLVLDEISEIEPTLQAKLLRVLEEGEYQRVGSNESLAVQARIIATSNRSLEREVESGRFRLDLYHRLKILHLDIAPLRERREDIPPLVAHFLADAREPGPAALAPATWEALLAYHWPGNTRELRNALQRARTVCSTELIEPADLPESVLGAAARSSRAEGDLVLTQPLSMREIERRVILWTLERFGGNKARAARHLGLTSRTIANKLREYQALETIPSLARHAGVHG